MKYNRNIYWRKSLRKFSKQEIKILKENPYTFNVTQSKLYFTTDFKIAFWKKYQEGIAPRKIIEELGYDLKLFHQKQIDSIVQRIKKQALSGNGFTEGENHERRMKITSPEEFTPESFAQMQHEVLYLKQEVEFLKKITKDVNTKREQ